MSIEFSRLAFHNTGSFDVSLAIFAPPDQLFAGGIEIKAGESNTLQFIASDCSAVKLSVTVLDPAHGSTFMETIGVSNTQSSKPLPLCLQAVEVSFFFGDFRSTVSASTDPAPAVLNVASKEKSH